MLLGKRELTATIDAELDIQAFPFDVHVLHLNIGLEADPSDAFLLPMRPAQDNGTPNVVDVAYDEILLPNFIFMDDLPHAQGVRTLRTLPPKNGPNRMLGAVAFSQAFASIPVARGKLQRLRKCGADDPPEHLCCPDVLVSGGNDFTRR